MDRLRGRVAVVTGGASGIGLEIARRFVQEGARVALGDVNEALLADAAQELGDACVTVVADVRREEDVERLVAAAVERHGRLDIGVNCAGLGALSPLVEQTLEEWETVVDICLTGVFLATKHEARAMVAGEDGGAIVNIASINARQPAEGMSAYCSAKAAVEMFTRVAAMELGPLGIRVTGIGPGLVDTPLTAYQREAPAFRQAYLETIPMGRVGTTADVAAAAVLLVSDEASWISGDTLFVDGAEMTRSYPRLLDLITAVRADAGTTETVS